MKTIYISKDEKILGGEPVIAGTRIPIERLAYLVKQGYTETNFKKEFPGVAITKIRGALYELALTGLRNLSTNDTIPTKTISSPYAKA